MLQTPLECVWRQWIRPLLYCDEFYLGHPSNHDVEITKEMYETLVYFVCDNPEEFENWLYKRAQYICPSNEICQKNKDRPNPYMGANAWATYLRKHAVRVSTPGFVFKFLLFAVPKVFIMFISAATITGLYTWFSKFFF